MNNTNQSMIQRKNDAVARGVGMLHPIFVESAENATVTDIEGNTFIDFSGGIGV